MSENSKPNIGAVMTLVHKAITRGLDMSKKQAIAFMQSGYPNIDIRDGFATYVRSMGSVINAHHLGEDHVVFPCLKSILPDTPFDQLLSEHREMDVLLRELQAAVEALTDPAQANISLDNLGHIITRLTDLWHPHIEKEQRYLYDISKTETLMTVDEQINLIQEASKHSQEQGNPALMVPFILFNLSPEDRAGIAQVMPPVLIQELVPIVWKAQWSPMQPFMLE